MSFIVFAGMVGAEVVFEDRHGENAVDDAMSEMRLVRAIVLPINVNKERPLRLSRDDCTQRAAQHSSGDKTQESGENSNVA